MATSTGAGERSATSPTGDAAIEPRNEVTLRGRLAAVAEARTLPSGDQIVTLRVVVSRHGGPTRPKPSAGATRRASVDTIDVTCWTARTRRAALRIPADAQIEVEGALRRRFFGGGVGPQSRYEVEAATVRRARPPEARRSPRSAT